MGTAVLDQVDVQKAVIVEVEKCRAGPHDLGHEVAVAGRDGAGVVPEGELSGFSHVLEPGRPVRLGGSDDQQVEVRSGVAADETVAVANTFLLKSELLKTAVED